MRTRIDAIGEGDDGIWRPVFTGGLTVYVE